MLTHFFGNYLLEKEIITSDQLLEAFRHKNNNTRKLGNLAVTAGYMTIEEVEDVYAMQAHMDGKFAEIAIHLGYLTVSQADELLQAQSLGYLLLGNSIISLGFCSSETISNAIADYEFDYQLSFSTVLNSDKEKVDQMIQEYYHFPESDAFNPPKEYATLLLKNLIRFVGDDFRLAGRIDSLPIVPNMYETTQFIESEAFDSRTAIIGYKDFLLEFGSRYACEKIDEYGEFAEAALQDFLNLHNGLFTVNVSNEHNIDATLSITRVTLYDSSAKSNCYILPIEFTFGTIYFCFT